MKIAMISSMVSAGLALACLGDGGMREFKLPDGRSLKASIIGYNARIGQVEIEREDGVRVKVAPSVFVEADQRYIREWVGLSGFRNPATFRIDCKKTKVEGWKKSDDFREMRFERFVYEIRFENRSGVDINNLSAEYCIFYEQEENELGGKISKADKIVDGKLVIERLRAEETRTETTNPVVIYSTHFNLTNYYVPSGDPQRARGIIKGIWLKAAVKTPGGAAVVRDVFEPASIEGKYAWPEAPRPQARRRLPGS